MKLCVIPARGGSKRIPRKNIKPFCGKPMIAWSIEAAIKSNCFDKIIVSTDDDEIADFDYSSLKLIEPLRTLRYIHFTAWITKRWEDPSFKNAFPQFGTEAYWETQTADLREQLSLIQDSQTPEYY